MLYTSQHSTLLGTCMLSCNPGKFFFGLDAPSCGNLFLFRCKSPPSREIYLNALRVSIFLGSQSGDFTRQLRGGSFKKIGTVKVKLPSLCLRYKFFNPILLKPTMGMISTRDLSLLSSLLSYSIFMCFKSDQLYYMRETDLN